MDEKFGNLVISTLTVNVIRYYTRILVQNDFYMQPQWCSCYSCHSPRSSLYVCGLPICPFALRIRRGFKPA